MQMNVLRTKQVSHVGNPDDHGQPIGQPIAQLGGAGADRVAWVCQHQLSFFVE